jgi:hypothetical protein
MFKLVLVWQIVKAHLLGVPFVVTVGEVLGSLFDSMNSSELQPPNPDPRAMAACRPGATSLRHSPPSSSSSIPLSAAAEGVAEQGPCGKAAGSRTGAVLGLEGSARSSPMAAVISGSGGWSSTAEAGGQRRRGVGPSLVLWPVRTRRATVARRCSCRPTWAEIFVLPFPHGMVSGVGT